MRRNLQQITALMLVGFGMVAAGLVYWGLVRAPALAARDDNPRLVVAELRIQRGRILDRHGHVLAESLPSAARPGAGTTFVRHYPYPQAAPVTGYYSLRYGTLAVEATYDTILRGTPTDFWQAQWQAWLHRQQQGRDVRLTLDLDLQRAADLALGDRRGAVVLLSLPEGAVRALASHPTYDPNRLDEVFDDLRADPAAPLLNRATQGLYQPGAALQVVTLAAALEQGQVSLDDAAPAAAAPFQLGQDALPCAVPPGPAPDYLKAFASACPSPFADLGPRLGPEKLLNMWSRFGLDQAPILPLPLSVGMAGPLSPDAQELRAAAVGQGNLLVTPLQMALVMATIAESGTQLQPTLVEAVQTEANGGRVWQPVEPLSGTQRVLSAPIARTLATALHQAATDGAAHVAAPPGIEVAGHAGIALAGPNTTHAWFIGFAPADMPRYAIAVLVEGSHDATEAARLAGAVLTEALR